MKKRVGLLAAVVAIAAVAAYVFVKKKAAGKSSGTKLLKKGKKMMGAPRIGEG